MGIHFKWDTLKVHKHYSYVSQAILKNVYNPLVKVDSKGNFQGLGARNWKVSNDSKEYSFEVDGRRRFSDGTPLEGCHYVNSWKKFMQVDSEVKHPGLVTLENNLAQKGLTCDKKKIKIKLKRSLRTLLSLVSEVQFAAIKWDGDKELGTGTHRFLKQNNRQVILAPNTHFPRKVNFNYEFTVIDKGKTRDFDIYDYSHNLKLDCLHRFQCNYGIDKIQYFLSLGEEGLFSDPKVRRSFLSLFYHKIKNTNQFKKIFPGLIKDFQVFLPFQAGRISESRLASYYEFDNGKYFKMINTIQPLEFLYPNMSPTGASILSFLKNELDVNLSERSGGVPFKEYLSRYGKEHRKALFFNIAYLQTWDPDGIYSFFYNHYTSRIKKTEEIFKQLEVGRMLVKEADIIKHYRGISHSLLSDYKFLHFGYKRRFFAYNKKKIKFQGILPSAATSNDFEKIRLINK